MTQQQSDGVDLRDLDVGDEVAIEIDGEEQFELVIVGGDRDEADDYVRGHVNLTAEGEGVWEQVKGRVESEVLNLRQHFERGDGEPRTPNLYGTVWKADDGAPKEAAEPHYQLLGEITAVDVEGDA